MSEFNSAAAVANEADAAIRIDLAGVQIAIHDSATLICQDHCR